MALLLGVDVGGDSAALVGGLAVVLASLGYAIGGFYLKARFKETQPIGVVTATMLASALLALPLALRSFPADAPGAGPIAAMAALGAGGTGIAFVIFYTLIADVGPAKASIVAYIAPVFAVIYGVAFRDEAFTLGHARRHGADPRRVVDRRPGCVPGAPGASGSERAEAADARPRPARPPVPAGGA